MANRYFANTFAQSDTSGRAGGLKNREPLEAVENREPP